MGDSGKLELMTADCDQKRNRWAVLEVRDCTKGHDEEGLHGRQ